MSRKRIFDLDDSDGEFEYPARLIESASQDAWESPTKAARKYQQPLKRRGTPKTNGQRQDQGIARGIQSNPSSSTLGAGSSMHMFGSEVHDVVGPPEPPTEPDPTERTPLALAGIAFTESQVARYLEAVECYSTGFYHIEGALFVVEGWDLQREQSTPGRWYHLEYLWVRDVLCIACTCPQGILGGCMHQAFFKAYEVEPLLRDRLVNAGDHMGETLATIFMRQQQPNSPDFVTTLSVRSLSASALKGRAIVTHIGTVASAGSWKCSRCSSATCAHISASKKVLEGLVGVGAEDSVDNTPALEPPPARPLASLGGIGSISYLPILPPLSAMLQSDKIMYQRPAPLRTTPLHILKLTALSSCPCPTGRTFWQPTVESVIRRCRVYSLYAVHDAQIQVQGCPSCPASRRRFIGPDLREQGIFNFNNSLLVTHELLDEYTMSFVTSETPFTAYVALVSHRYAVSGSVFMGEDAFRSVWFSYAALQALDDDMRCTRCGPSPETVIWDGITLAFGRKHLSSTLKPPTHTSSASAIRPKIKNQPKLQLLPDGKLRKKLRQVLKRPSASQPSDDEDSGEEESGTLPKTLDQQRQASLLEDHLNKVQGVHAELTVVCPELGTLFLHFYGAVALLEKRVVPPIYRSLFLQVAAEESVLQMINGSSLDDLRTFLADPQPHRITDVLSIPAVYKVLRVHSPMEPLIPVLNWMMQRAIAVLALLSIEEPLVNLDPMNPVEDDWKLSGCHYSLPQIRHRPIYPNLKTDQKKDTGSKPRGDQCGKYYTQYGERRLTGGIMVVWCSHSICYGFHCIPESEGRNDVFSAMLTRWPTAPKRVIYDFACALGPYCMLREPEFFKNTFFAIDLFHSAGHTKCSPAAFLSEYANIDPRLVPINSSAGECGNSSLKRIRKSVSYMGQDRAILYTKTFLSVWNRLRLLKL